MQLEHCHLLIVKINNPSGTIDVGHGLSKEQVSMNHTYFNIVERRDLLRDKLRNVPLSLTGTFPVGGYFVLF